MIEDNKKIEILYDHYKDTVQHQMKYIENRNRYFLYSLLLISVLFFQISYPDVAEDLVRRITQKQVDENFILDFSIVNSLFLFGLLWVLILYFQMNITIDKQFKYLHKIEEDLSNQLTPIEITREGKFYKHNRPLVSKFISVIYRIIYPICILTSIVIKVIFDFKYASNIFTGSILANLTLSIIAAIVTILFFVWSNQKMLRKLRFKPKKEAT